MDILSLNEENKRLAQKGFLPRNPELQETESSCMEDVENNPREFIIEECLPACQKLWRNNIYTFMTSNHLNEGECWIEVIYDNLSDENKEILLNLSGKNVIKFSYHDGCASFGIRAVGSQGQRRLFELASNFQMQDVPFGEAYITVEEFLTKCGCFSKIINPNYYYMAPPWTMNLPVSKLIDYIDEYDEWLNSSFSKKTFTIFDKEKMTKPLEAYLQEAGVIYADNRVYLSEYHYQKHLNYVNYISQKRKIR